MPGLGFGQMCVDGAEDTLRVLIHQAKILTASMVSSLCYYASFAKHQILSAKKLTKSKSCQTLVIRLVAAQPRSMADIQTNRSPQQKVRHAN